MDYRRAQPGDEGAIAQVHVSAWQGAYRGMIPDAYLDGLSLQSRTDTWRGLLEQLGPPAQDALVAVEGSEVLGFVHFSPSRDPDAGSDVGEVTAIYVHQDRWGEGIGRALLQRAVEQLDGSGFTSTTLWVLDVNARARGFYEAAGWQPDGAARRDERAGFVLTEVRYARLAPSSSS